MIYENGKSIAAIYHNNEAIIAVYHGSDLVWQLNNIAYSCFANGYWIDEYPWTDEHCWNDGLLNT